MISRDGDFDEQRGGDQTAGVLRIAAVGDIHCNKSSSGKLRAFFADMQAAADVLLFCGDLTNHGFVEEAEILADEIASTVTKPVLAVFGNHDYDAGKQGELERRLSAAGVRIMDGDACVVEGVGFAGVKGFGGGFEEHSLGYFGEPSLKQFVQDAMDEARKLDDALSKLATLSRVVLMHYSPIRDTLEGEPPEIFPFLGSKRLEEPINRYDVTAVFHGHAHHGSPEAKSSTGVPVYNVALPLLAKEFRGRPPFRILEVSNGASYANLSHRLKDRSRDGRVVL